MSFHHLDRWADTTSPLGRLPATVRLAGVVVLATGAACLPEGAWLQTALLLLLLGAVVAAARIPFPAFLLRLIGPLSAVVLVSAALTFLVPGDPVWQLGPVVFTRAGVVRFGSVVGRAAVGLGAATLLVSTTRFTEVVSALRAWHLPRAVTMSLGLAYRFLYLLTDEVDRILVAARSRNAGGGTGQRRRLLVGTFAAVLDRSLARSDRTWQAMLARGSDGQIPSLGGRPVQAPALVALVGFALLVLLISLSARMPL